MKRILVILMTLSLMLLGTSVFAQLWSDDFNVDTSANYLDTSTTDTAVSWAFDYSTLVGATIGVAPNTGDATTLGLTLEANLSTVAVSAANIYTGLGATGEFSGNYKVTCDVYSFWEGAATGSTEFTWVSVNHSGTQGISLGISTNDDGYFLCATGDGGSSNDYRFFEGVNPGTNIGIVGSGEFGTAMEWGDGLTDDNLRNGADAFFSATLFPATVGDFGGQWVTVVIDYNQDEMEISYNGTEVLSYDDPDDSWTSGRVLLAHEDAFTSVATGGALNTPRGVFDNLLVETATSINEWSVY
jgi:hypothetical protein